VPSSAEKETNSICSIDDIEIIKIAHHAADPDTAAGRQTNTIMLCSCQTIFRSGYKMYKIFMSHYETNRAAPYPAQRPNKHTNLSSAHSQVSSPHLERGQTKQAAASHRAGKVLE
jgi:hypothetical protein